MLFKEKRTVGLDIGSNAIKAVGLRKGKKIQVDFLKAIDLYQSRKVSRPGDLSDTLLVQVVRELLGGIKGGLKKVKTSVSSTTALTRMMELPLLPDDELKAAIRWDVAHIIPFDMEGVEFDYHVLDVDKNRNRQMVIVGLVAGEEMNRHLDILSRTNLEPEIVDIDTLSVYNCFVALHDLQEGETEAVLDIGSERTNLIMLNPPHNPFFKVITLGGNTLTRAIEKHFHTPFINAEKRKLLVDCQRVNDAWLMEQSQDFQWVKSLLGMVAGLAEGVKRADIYYQIMQGVGGIKRVFLTGGGSKLKNLDVLLANDLQIPVIHWNPLKEEKLGINDQQDEVEEWGPHFAVALGLALREEV
ncbi:type IV pilus assembly protein PilM [candidate division KSB1 bacterium]|nr:type IV pilus assembly protein PilM [candidate division KSB1 bacterium]